MIGDCRHRREQVVSAAETAIRILLRTQGEHQYLSFERNQACTAHENPHHVLISRKIYLAVDVRYALLKLLPHRGLDF